ncbi:MAG: archaellar assembly protein FlaJ [Chloroflexi bacterium]|nr:archaellar assembly protein FlaJ [Chloroflexota bacterium]
MVSIAAKMLGRGKSKKPDIPDEVVQSLSKINKDDRRLYFDLLMQVQYMASMAMAKASRDLLFEKAASMNLTSTPYFRDVQTMTTKLGLDYSQACTMVAERTDKHDISQFLLRTAGSMKSGEDEGIFLTRESEVLAEQYSEKYGRDVESLKKWTDAYTALVVSVGLVVVVSIISMMIYQISTIFLVGVSFTAVGAVSLGAWIIYLSAPKEAFVRTKGLSSKDQKRAMSLFKILVPPGAALASITLITVGLGPAMIVIALVLLPPGFMMNRDSKKIARRDVDMAVFVRILGGVASAIGTTLGEAIGRIDRRSMSAIQDDIEKLDIRLKAGIKSDLCWQRFIDDSGSELIDRTTRIFVDGTSSGGEASEIGNGASFFAQQLVLLREKRSLVASSFAYLVPPLHASVVGLMVFIVNVLSLFSSQLTAAVVDVQTDPNTAGQSVPSLGLGTFSSLDMDFLNLLVTATVLMLTFANGFVMATVGGGHWMKMAYSFAILALITGFMMTVIPGMSESVFATVSENP